MKSEYTPTPVERDQLIADTLLKNMTELQKQEFYDVINNHFKVQNKLLEPAIFGEEELNWYPSIKISFGLAGQVTLKNLP